MSQQTSDHVSDQVSQRRDGAGGALLAVFAHPDDESLACGGLLACCADRGVRVTLLCVTHGEHGSTPDGEPRERLAARRQREIEAAAAVLGAAEVRMLDYEDGYLPWVDAVRLESDIARAVADTAADVVITFDEDGLYWHPDHIALHERTTAAVAALGDAGPVLYYATMPPGRMRAVQQTVAARHPQRPGPHHILGVADADAFGAEAPAPSLVLDVRLFAPRKLAALQCHVSQVAGGALEVLCTRDAAELLGVEHLRRALVGSQGATFIDGFAEATPLTSR